MAGVRDGTKYVGHDVKMNAVDRNATLLTGIAKLILFESLEKIDHALAQGIKIASGKLRPDRQKAIEVDAATCNSMLLDYMSATCLDAICEDFGKETWTSHLERRWSQKDLPGSAYIQKADVHVIKLLGFSHYASATFIAESISLQYRTAIRAAVKGISKYFEARSHPIRVVEVINELLRAVKNDCEKVQFDRSKILRDAAQLATQNVSRSSPYQDNGSCSQPDHNADHLLSNSPLPSSFYAPAKVIAMAIFKAYRAEIESDGDNSCEEAMDSLGHISDRELVECFLDVAQTACANVRLKEGTILGEAARAIKRSAGPVRSESKKRGTVKRGTAKRKPQDDATHGVGQSSSALSTPDASEGEAGIPRRSKRLRMASNPEKQQST